jgi:ATP-dependent Clp protease ATP-binding subunit ClpB
MRFDKLTTKFQQALADAQSIAVGADNPTIEAQHLLLAMLNQDDGGTSALLARAGVQVNALKNVLNSAIGKLPTSSENNGEVSISRDLNNLLNVTDKLAQKRNDAYIASEMFLLALADDKGETAKLLKQNGLSKTALETAIQAVRGSGNVDSQEAEGQR